jgi:hypothetical protein
LSQTVTTNPPTIRFKLDASRTITFSGALAHSLKPGVVLEGKADCNDSTLPVTLNGNNANGDGLRLASGNVVRGLIIRGFRERQIVAEGGGNFIECSQISR